MSQQIIIDYWVEKAGEDLASARDNLKSDRHQNAVRDAYFACFHAFSAVLLKEGKTFKKHKEVRSMLHRDFIRSKKIDSLMRENTMIGFLIIGIRRIIDH